jgi:hypothetical protein
MLVITQQIQRPGLDHEIDFCLWKSFPQESDERSGEKNISN